MKLRIMFAALAIALSGAAYAKLPPPTDEQKAAAEAEAKQGKGAEAAAPAVDALTAAQDRVAARWAQIKQQMPAKPAGQ